MNIYNNSIFDGHELIVEKKKSIRLIINSKISITVF